MSRRLLVCVLALSGVVAVATVPATAGVTAVRAAPGLAAARAAPGVTAPRAAVEPKRTKLFTFADERITESSGLAVSAVHDGIIYTHNDSGDGPSLYAVDRDGRTRAVLTLRGARARDWEALAPGSDASGRPLLWVGDIGDNFGGWWREIRVYRVPEPATVHSADVEWTEYRLRYEDGARDAEALLTDPLTGQLYVVSKQNSGAGVYAAPRELRTDAVNVLRRVADAPPRVTDGAFLPDGQHIVLRGYFSATVWDRRWREVATLALPMQGQGESLAVTRDGGAILLGSEGEAAEVWQVPIAEWVPVRSPAPAPRQAPDSFPSRHVEAVVGVLTAVVLLALAGVLIPKRR